MMYCSNNTEHLSLTRLLLLLRGERQEMLCIYLLTRGVFLLSCWDFDRK